MKFRAALVALALPLLASAQVFQGVTVVQPTLIADTTAIVPGQPFRVGLVLKMAPTWHTYWQYAGDAGIPTRIDWKLPSGFGIGPIEWPLPEAILEPGDIEVYAFGGEIMLLQTIPFMTDVNANTSLHAVGASYGVRKLATDAPHWSHDGH